jgi:hypothetical protein
VNIKRRQHILPESYLLNWVDPSTTAPKKTPMVWVFSKDMKTRRAKAPGTRRFWREYFYDLVSASGDRRQDLENLLGRIEGAVAAVTQDCILRKQPLSPEQADAIDLFVACMFMRTEKMRDSVMSFAGAIARIERDHAAARKRPVPNRETFQRNAHAFAIYDGVILISDYLRKMSHRIFIAPPQKSYLTSDTPCLWQAALGEPCLENPTFETSLTLTPKHMLHISKTIPTSGYLEAPDYLVDQTNWEIIRGCREYFVSNCHQADPCWQHDGSERLKILLEGALALQ